MKAGLASLAVATAILAGCSPASAPKPEPGSTPSVVIGTDRGDITVALDVRAAPRTVCNFLRYVESGTYAGGSVFRTVVSTTDPNAHPIDVIQAGTPAGDSDPGLGAIALERTRDTGLRHVAGTISMARDGPDTATSSFFIVTKDAPALDYGGLRHPDGQGFAAFGRVVEGMPVVQAIHALPARDEAIVTPVKISGVTLATPRPEECGA